MKIDGKLVAEEITGDLKRRVEKLKKKNMLPQLAIILIGDDPASQKYVEQKIKKAREIGAVATAYNFDNEVKTAILVDLIQKLNNDPKIHGLIVQRPLPPHINGQQTIDVTNPQKDVDAFHKDSPFHAPLPEAIVVLLQKIHSILESTHTSSRSFIPWLHSKKIVVVGKGITAGGPTIARLKELGITPQVIDSKTEEDVKKNLLKNADIVITTVGEKQIITPQLIKKGVILLGAGMSKGADGKLHGDYNHKEIQNIASFYTPIPGGVGPVNVAMLLQNLVTAAEKQTV